MYKLCDFIGKKSKATFYIAETDGGWNWRTATVHLSKRSVFSTTPSSETTRKQARSYGVLRDRLSARFKKVKKTAFLGPALFLVIVNEFAYRSSYCKYVDGITISEVNPHAWSAINYTR